MMRGTIYLANTAGRALRRAAAAIYLGDVLYCSGEFACGDPIHIAFLGADGGQYVVASGIAQLSGDTLRDALGAPLADAHARVPAADAHRLVVQQSDVRVLWPTV